MSVRLILASESPRRLDVLKQLALRPEVRPASLDEVLEPGEGPAEHVERLARAKAELVALDVPDALVVGGDTIVLRDERVLGKPESEEQAVQMLMSLAGRSHEVLSGLAVAGAARSVASGVSRTTVRFRDFDRAVAGRYVASGEPMDKAGAYGIQGLGAALVESIDGDYYSVVGFPVALFLKLIERAGWRYDFGRLHRLDT
ncbi:MAG: Maf family protein [Gemmatimonadota bacterium]|jgi:septum formation protein